MNIFRSLTALLSFVSALVPAQSIDVDTVKERHLRSRSLQTPDGTIPAIEDVCDQYKGLEGPAYGLCNAYCEAKDCDYSLLDIKSCDKCKISEKFEELTNDKLPCDCPEVIYTAYNYGLSLGWIDPVSGAGSDVGPFGPTPFGSTAYSLATDPTDEMKVYTLLGGLRLATVDQDTGAATPVDATGVNTVQYMYALAVDPTEEDPTRDMYGVDYSNDVLYRINKTTGIATAIGNTGTDNKRFYDLAFDSDGTLYGITANTGSNRIWTINTATGAATELGLVGGVSGRIHGIMFNRSDTLYAIAPDGNLYTVDLPEDGSGPLASHVDNTGLKDTYGGAFGCA